jgi:hypothetical protein
VLRGESEGCSIRSGESGESTSLADRSKKEISKFILSAKTWRRWDGSVQQIIPYEKMDVGGEKRGEEADRLQFPNQ